MSPYGELLGTVRIRSTIALLQVPTNNFYNDKVGVRQNLIPESVKEKDVTIVITEFTIYHSEALVNFLPTVFKLRLGGDLASYVPSSNVNGELTSSTDVTSVASSEVIILPLMYARNRGNASAASNESRFTLRYPLVLGRYDLSNIGTDTGTDAFTFRTLAFDPNGNATDVNYFNASFACYRNPYRTIH